MAARKNKTESKTFVRVRGFVFDDATGSADCGEHNVILCPHGTGLGFRVDDNGDRIDGPSVEIVEILGPATILSPIEKADAMFKDIQVLADTLSDNQYAGRTEKSKGIVSLLLNAIAYGTGVPVSMFTHWLGEGRLEIRLDTIELHFTFNEDCIAMLYDADDCPFYEHYDPCSVSSFISVISMHIRTCAKESVSRRVAAARVTLSLAQALQIEGL